ncbi:MAG: hypothetical protein ACR2IE_03010 [Candidatus Sumerlaeaceae bacterium]
MESRRLVVAACLSLCTAAFAEVPPANTLPCFPGAYYRKAVSSQDMWSGIEGVITLPDFQPDPERVNPDNGKSLDNPSIYLGGRAENQEIDAGLSWEVIKEPDGSVSPIRRAFRPFWRNKEWHSGPAKPDFYYYPGDQIRIRLETTEANKLRMSIELLSRGESGKPKALEPAPPSDPLTTATAETETTGSSVAGKTTNTKAILATGTVPTSSSEKGHGKDFAATSPDALTSLSVNFDAPNFGPGRIQEFKRVNAIDQSGNEGRGVVPTKARVMDATWTEVYLLRRRLRVPMTDNRFTDMRCPDKKHFTVFSFDNTGERICIRGAEN